MERRREPKVRSTKLGFVEDCGNEPCEISFGIYQKGKKVLWGEFLVLTHTQKPTSKMKHDGGRIKVRGC